VSATAGIRTAVEDRRSNRPDVLLLSMVVGLSLFGLLMIYSVTRFDLERSDQLPTISMERQMIFVTAGFIALFLFSRIDYREYRNFLPMIFGAIVLLLLAVFLFDPIKGARRWIPFGVFNFQPAEFAKIVGIMAAAQLLQHVGEGERLEWRTIGKSGVLVGIPMMLVFLQPDLGTTMVFPFIWLVMLAAAGLNWKQFTTLVVGGVTAVVAMFQFGLLREHQLERIQVFLDPTIDPQGIGYTLRQSKLAIGSGQLFGKGLFEGTQTNLAYVPEQETDFIFTAVGEQFGFIGGVIVIAAFLFLMWRLVVIAALARDRYGTLLVVGIAAMIMFHVFVNIGMTIGIAPVTGLPLPFLSQGGSFFMAMAVAAGIANSVYLRRSPVPGEPFMR
jgi:rod shape determining protein RodA